MPEPHQYIGPGASCRRCHYGRLNEVHYEEPRTPEELDRAMFLELRRGLLYAVKAIEKRFDLTGDHKPAAYSQQKTK